MSWLDEIRARCESPLAHPVSTGDALRLLAIAEAAQKLVEELERCTLCDLLAFYRCAGLADQRACEEHAGSLRAPRQLDYAEPLRELLAALGEGEKT